MNDNPCTAAPRLALKLRLKSNLTADEMRDLNYALSEQVFEARAAQQRNESLLRTQPFRSQ